MRSNFNNLNVILAKYDNLFILIGWLLATGLLYLKFGFGFQLESIKYIREADYLIETQSFSQARYLFYFGTIAVIALNKLLGTGLYGAIVMIMLINICAYLSFYKALKHYFHSRLPAVVAVLLLICFWPYQQWTLFLYTECLFYSLLLLLFAHLLRVNRLTARSALVSIVLLALLTVTRPLGMLFIIPVLAFFFTLMNRTQKIYFWIAFGLTIGVGFWIIQIVFTSTPDWNMQRAVMEENIICDMTPSGITYHPTVTDSTNPIYQLVYYITHNFQHFAGLALTRLRYFFGMVRPYYSITTNLFIGVYLLVIYGWIIAGIRRQGSLFPKRILLFIWGAVGLFALAIAVQCDDYHNRFFLVLLPLFVTMAVASAWKRINRVSS